MSSGSSGSRVAYPAPVFASICDFTSLIVAAVCLLARLHGGLKSETGLYPRLCEIGNKWRGGYAKLMHACDDASMVRWRGGRTPAISASLAKAYLL
jgi:hypothetical protein